MIEHIIKILFLSVVLVALGFVVVSQVKKVFKKR